MHVVGGARTDPGARSLPPARSASQAPRAGEGGGSGPSQGLPGPSSAAKSAAQAVDPWKHTWLRVSAGRKACEPGQARPGPSIRKRDCAVAAAPPPTTTPSGEHRKHAWPSDAHALKRQPVLRPGPEERGASAAGCWAKGHAGRQSCLGSHGNPGERQRRAGNLAACRACRPRARQPHEKTPASPAGEGARHGRGQVRRRQHDNQDPSKHTVAACLRDSAHTATRPLQSCRGSRRPAAGMTAMHFG